CEREERRGGGERGRSCHATRLRRATHATLDAGSEPGTSARGVRLWRRGGRLQAPRRPAPRRTGFAPACPRQTAIEPGLPCQSAALSARLEALAAPPQQARRGFTGAACLFEQARRACRGAVTEAVTSRRGHGERSRRGAVTESGHVEARPRGGPGPGDRT